MNEVKPPWHYLLLLVLAGESIFILPFVLPRIFRPTVLSTFGLDNTELGLLFSVYGTVALVAYLFGGPIADKFAPRKLIAVALWATAIAGSVYAQYPSFGVLQIIYGYWGFTTIFLFWAPMIKAARIWGGSASQGKAYGFLEAGRGLVGAIIGSLGVIIFSIVLGDAANESSSTENQNAFKYVIYAASTIIIIVGFLVWNFMKLSDDQSKEISLDKIDLNQIKSVLRIPAVWLLMVIILCAYVGYKVTDILSLYAKDVMLYDEVQSAQVGTFLLFIRPITGVLIGVYADRFETTRWLFYSFMVSFIGTVIFASGILSASFTLLFFISILIIAAGVYAARALYFAVMQKGNIPMVYTGTAVGLISLIGYTPDIFSGPLMGVLLDSNPGEIGHQYVFWMLAGFTLVGAMAAYFYDKRYGINKK